MTDRSFILRDSRWRHLCATVKGIAERLLRRWEAWCRVALGLIHGRPGVSVLVNQARRGSCNPIGWSGAISIALLVSCQSMPIMVPDMALKPASPVRLDGFGGPLTTKQSKAIIAVMKSRGVDTNIFDRHLAMEAEIVGSPLIVGNSVDLLVDGPATYAAMFDAIEHAKSCINIETYIIEDDDVGQRFANLIIRKQSGGVQVNMIYDSIGSIRTAESFFVLLKGSGVNVLEYNPINPFALRKGWQVNQRDHRKLLIVDGEVAFVGGVNISSVYSSGSFGRSKTPVSSGKGRYPWRDTHLRMRGPVVAEFQKLFISTWVQQKGEPMADRDYFPQLGVEGNAVVRAIGSSPEEPYSQIYLTLLSAINSAETYVFITNAYFVPDQQLLNALKGAVKRGVDVRLLLPGKTDSVWVFYASHSYFDELLSSGVKIYERKGALLHAKTALIDGVWSTVGSTNLDWRSFLHNQEINAVVLGHDFGLKMETLFLKDIESSDPLTLQAWRKRSIGVRIKEKTARLWAYWL